MSLRRRLVVGMLLLLVAGLITTDVVTSSSLRSFLLGRLDEQIDASQNQAYTYISQVYQRDLAAGDRTPVTDPGTWLAELGTKAPRRGAFTARRRPADPAPQRRGPGRPPELRRLRRGPVVERHGHRPGALGPGRQPRPRPGAAAGAARPAHPDAARVRHQPRPLRAREPVDRRARRRVAPGRSTGSQAVAVPGRHPRHRHLARPHRQDPGVADPRRADRVDRR